MLSDHFAETLSNPPSISSDFPTIKFQPIYCHQPSSSKALIHRSSCCLRRTNRIASYQVCDPSKALVPSQPGTERSLLQNDNAPYFITLYCMSQGRAVMQLVEALRYNPGGSRVRFPMVSFELFIEIIHRG